MLQVKNEPQNCGIFCLQDSHQSSGRPCPETDEKRICKGPLQGTFNEYQGYSPLHAVAIFSSERSVPNSRSPGQVDCHRRLMLDRSSAHTHTQTHSPPGLEFHALLTSLSSSSESAGGNANFHNLFLPNLPTNPCRVAEPPVALQALHPNRGRSPYTNPCFRHKQVQDLVNDSGCLACLWKDRCRRSMPDHACAKLSL